MSTHPRRGHTVRMDAAASLRSKPDDYLIQTADTRRVKLDSMSTLDLMISLGWGDTPQTHLPSDWRTRKNPRGRAGWG